MTVPAKRQTPDQPREPRSTRARRWPLGLSGKLLLLTLVFVMLAEVLIYVPSIANFRLTWLRERLAAAQIASLALEAAPDLEVSSDLSRELLTNAQVIAVVLKRGNARQLILRAGMPPDLSARFDLRDASMSVSPVLDAFETLFAPPGRVIGVVDNARFGAGDSIEVVIDESLLKEAMLRFSVNVLSLSIVISIITATLVYLTLNAVLVRPMRRLWDSMLLFGENPEDTSRVIEPSGRGDEIGRAETVLATMQRQLQSMLQQKAHLAALGLAVSKINHDLRNILAHAQLMSDRLGMIRDPAAERLAPKLIGALDRAIELCTNTLKYGKADEAPPDRTRFPLAPLVEEVAEAVDIDASVCVFRSLIDSELTVDADRDHLFRIVLNLVRNADQAIRHAGTTGGDAAVANVITASAWRSGSVVTIRVEDTGPGIPDHVRPKLFDAFQGTATPGGTGLGLAIAAELTRAHGGEIRLCDVLQGSAFEVDIPDTVARIARSRARQMLSSG